MVSIKFIAKLLPLTAFSSLSKTASAETIYKDVTNVLNSEFIQVLGITHAEFDGSGLHLVLHTQSQNFTENEGLIQSFFDSTNARTMTLGDSKGAALLTPAHVYGKEKFKYDNSTDRSAPISWDNIEIRLSSNSQCGNSDLFQGSLAPDTCIGVAADVNTLAIMNLNYHSAHVWIYDTPEKCQGDKLDHWIKTHDFDCLGGPDAKFWIGPHRYNVPLNLPKDLLIQE